MCVFFHGSRVENVMLSMWELVQSLRDHGQSLRTPRGVRAEEWNFRDFTVLQYVGMYVQCIIYSLYIQYIYALCSR